jgi:hypothetical protein
MKYGITLMGAGTALIVSGVTIAGVLTLITGITWSFLAVKRQEAMNMEDSNNTRDFPKNSAA